MFPNLQAEQKRMNMTNQQVADKIGMSRVTYESKKKSGSFYVSECDVIDGFSPNVYNNFIPLIDGYSS